MLPNKGGFVRVRVQVDTCFAKVGAHHEHAETVLMRATWTGSPVDALLKSLFPIAIVSLSVKQKCCAIVYLALDSRYP